MASIPVVCDNCGAFFMADNLIGGEGGAWITFENVGFGPCPVCGEMGRVLDGTYEFVGGTARLLSGPEWTHDRLRRVFSLVHEVAHASVADRPAAAKNAFAALEKEEPSLAAQFTPKTAGELIALLTLLWLVLQALLGLGPNHGMSEKDVEKVIRAVMEQAQQPHDGAVSRPKAPPPPPRKRHRAAKKKRQRR